MCHNCVYWKNCFFDRYDNIQKDYMIKVRRKDNPDGNTVIYVLECSKFKEYKGLFFEKY